MNRGILIIVLAIALSIVVHLIQTFDGLGQTEDENDVISIGGGNRLRAVNLIYFRVDH
ncbi:MAG: hypothetical protein KKE05_02475 [Nanoarchaeota archaeon]|nr:hypothetical protein [Nanoarchaeota archaeon]